MSDTVKVRVVVDVEINRADYDAEYGTHETVAQIKEFIKMSVGEAAMNGLNHLGQVGVLRSFDYR